MNIPAIIFWVLLVLFITKAAVFSGWWIFLFFVLACLSN